MIRQSPTSGTSVCGICKHPTIRSGRNTGRNTLPRERSKIKRDPPGQQCAYIPPGDHRKETYRLSTFTCFQNNQISIFDLAEAGFYYTGYKDRTKCFSCGNDVEGWISGDSPFDLDFHEVDCAITCGQEFHNVPSDRTLFKNLRKQLANLNTTCTCNPNVAGIQHQQSSNGPSSSRESSTSNIIPHLTHTSQPLPTLKLAQVYDQQHKEVLTRLNLCKEVDRRKTFAKWPTYPAPYLPKDLAQEGFFYLGNLDRAQCFSCSGVLRNWAPSDDVKQQHQTHFPSCRLHDGTDPRNIKMTAEQRARVDHEDADKLSTLLPTGDVSEPRDPSLEEQRYLAEKLPCNSPINPHMTTYQARIESFRRWPTGKTKATVEQLAKAGMFYLGESDQTKCFYCNGGLQNWDYNDEPWTEHAKWFPGCEFVNRCKGLRFVRQLTDAHPNLKRPSIRNGISIREIPDFQPSPSQGHLPNSSGAQESEETAAKMVQAVGGAAGVQHQQCSLESQHQQQLPLQNCEDTSLANTFREVTEAMICKSCKTRKSDTLFLPCGHVVSCNSCASKLKKCLSCSSIIKDSMRIYRS